MAAGLVAGGWAASAVISKLMNELIEYAMDQKEQLGLEDELARLKTGLPKIQVVLNDVDQGLTREVSKPLEEWLWQLRDAADQAEDVMDEMKYYLVKENAEAENKVSVVKVFLERVLRGDPMLKKLKETVKVIDNVVSDIGNFNKIVCDLVENQKEAVNLANSNRQTGSLVNANTVYGREKEKEEIINKLLNPKCETKGVNFAVLPIIGQGGIGKTTLAQAVYNDPIVQNHFKLKIWVHISDKIDTVFLMKKLYQSVFQRNADVDEYSLIERMVYDKLQSQRFLVVFDDAWNDSDEARWDNLVTPLKSGSSGSMILLTTRMKKFAPLIKHNLMESVYLGGLEEHNIWNLLKESVFGDKDARCDEQLEILGRQISKKLNGSPLAAKIVGGMLRSNLNDQFWRSISESELWCLDQKPDGIMPVLRLTYQHMPSHLKPCFSFCSIFPQDHIFIKDDLINMWVALGLVPRDFSGEKRPEDVGSEYFEDMLKRSIFTPANPVRNVHLQYPSYTYCNIAEKQFVGGYIMHDLMHDLSSFVSQGECFRSDRNESIPIPPTVRHLYIHVGDCRELSNLKLKNVRALILQFDDYNPTKLVCVLNELLRGMTSLRLLTLLSLKLSEIPESIGDLLHLRYLSLSSFMLGEFPSSMSRLYLLETIVCGGFGFTNQANVLVKLINLRHIIASESFVETIAGIGKLTSLQELSFRVDKEIGFRISELSNLRELRRLAITNINDVVDHEEAKQANLRDKIGLNELILQWDTTGFDEKVFDHLQPNCNLKELIIRNYMGRRSPFWESGSLSSLVKLEICDCHNLITIDEGLLRNPNAVLALQELIIANCKGLKMPEKGFIEFVSLKRLDISGCPNIKLFSVLVLFPPSKLQFLRINNYVQDSREKNSYVKDVIADLTIPEADLTIPEVISLQNRQLQAEEAELFLLDHPGKNSNWEVRLLRIRDYTSKWPTTWLTQTLSMLDSLYIDGRPSEHKYHFSGLPNEICRLLKFIISAETSCGVFPSVDMAYPSDMSELVQIYLATPHIKCMQNLKKLRIAVCSKTCVMPSLPITLKELTLYNLGLVVIPNLFANEGSDLSSFPSLVSIEINYCPNLESLAEGLFQKPQQFVALEKLKISSCQKLRKLPQGGFNKFISLKELDIASCPEIEGQLVPKCFLPSALQVLHVFKCGDLDANLSKALESVDSLISLVLYDCKKIRSLPPKEVFSRWETLDKLNFEDCDELTSLECLLGLSSVRVLTISRCPKLVSEIASPSAGKKDEIEGMAEGSTLQTSNRPASTQPKSTDKSSSTNTEHKSLLSVDELKIDDPRLLYIEPIRNLSSVRKLTIRCSGMQSLPELPPIIEDAAASTQPTPTDPCSSTNTEHKPLLSVDELQIDDPLLLSIEPIRSLSSVRKLTITWCFRIQSLPVLPPFLEELCLYDCSPELKRRCEELGEDWPKLSHIPKVSISGLFDTHLAEGSWILICAQQEDLEGSQPH